MVHIPKAKRERRETLNYWYSVNGERRFVTVDNDGEEICAVAIPEFLFDQHGFDGVQQMVMKGSGLNLNNYPMRNEANAEEC